jgi:seryl-tRNA synthetase
VTWQGEICGRCGRRNVIGFDVTNEVWLAVVRGRWNVVCPTCFDVEAEHTGVRYRFGATWPVSWSDWSTA